MITELYTVYRAELLRYCCMICGNVSDAEDLLQETFMRALSNLDLLEDLGEKERRAWLYKVARNLFYDACRRRTVEQNTEIDNLFIQRAANTLYYSSGNLFFLDTKLDTEALIQKGLTFEAKKIVMAESLVDKLISLFDEEAEIVRVPDGASLIDDDLELKPKTIKKYGTKLLVTGDVSILDAEALSSLEYLFSDGIVCISKDLEEAFDEIESIYDELKVIDPDQGLLSDRPILKVGPTILKRYPHGVRVEDCAKVTLSEDLTPEDIMAKLHISDCAMVICSKEQEEAVNMIAEDVAMIKVAGSDPDDETGDGMVGGILGDFFGKLKDAQVINAAEYKM